MTALRPRPGSQEPGDYHYIKSHFITAISDRAIATMVTFYVERYAGHVRAIQSAHARRSASVSKYRPINTKADAAGGSPAPCRTSSHWYTP